MDHAPALSPTALAALVTAAVPGVEPATVHAWHLEGRRAHQVARVEDSQGRSWVVRSPLTASAGAQLERNDALLRLLAEHLPFGVPVAAGFADRPGVGRAGVYPALEGSPIRLDALPPGRGLASAIGRALAALHNTPLGVFEEAGAPGYDADGYRRRLLAHLDRAAESGHVPTGLLARWEQALELQALWEFTPVGTHGSLDGSSVLAAFAEDDAASGRVTALVGWEGPQVADPADDLAFIAADSPPGALESVIDSYRVGRADPVDPHLGARARLAAEMIDLHDLASAVEAGDHDRVAAHAEALRRLDRYTSGSPSLVPAVLLAGPAPVVAPDAVAAGSGTPAPTTAGEVWVDDADATGEIHSPFAHREELPQPAAADAAADVDDGGWGGPALPETDEDATGPVPVPASPGVTDVTDLTDVPDTAEGSDAAEAAVDSDDEVEEVEEVEEGSDTTDRSDALLYDLDGPDDHADPDTTIEDSGEPTERV